MVNHANLYCFKKPQQQFSVKKYILAVILFGLLMAGCVTVPLQNLEPLGVGATFRVVSYNLAFDDLNVPDDQAKKRFAALAGVIENINADIVLLQEVVTVDGWEISHPNRILAFLVEALPQYVAIAPTGSAKMADSNPILIRRSRFFPVQQGVEWYSSSPWVPDSCRSQNRLPRYFVWALLFDRETNEHVIVANTHFDYMSKVLNEEAANQLLAFMSRWSSLPRLFGGDFNSVPGSTVLATLESEYQRVLSGNLAPTIEGFPFQIDQLFVSDQIKLVAATVIESGPDNPSDHRPIFADLVVTSQNH